MQEGGLVIAFIGIKNNSLKNCQFLFLKGLIYRSY